MDQQLKQRLVGVTVIFSLAVIFLPMLLDGSGNRPKHLDIEMPEIPTITSYDIVDEKVVELKKKVEVLPQLDTVIIDEVSINPTPEVIKADKSIKTVEIGKAEAAQIKAEVTVEKPPKKVADEFKKESLKKQAGGLSWVIQVGSFSDKNKAYKQRDRIRNYKLAAAFIEKFSHDGKLSYRVRLGPFISKNKAKVIGNKIRAKYNIKGLVMRYEK